MSLKTPPVCSPAKERAKGAISILLLLNLTAKSRLGEQAAFLQKTAQSPEANEKLLKFRLELALEL